jgi:hypothetical protein
MGPAFKGLKDLIFADIIIVMPQKNLGISRKNPEQSSSELGQVNVQA